MRDTKTERDLKESLKEDKEVGAGHKRQIRMDIRENESKQLETRVTNNLTKDLLS